MKDAASVDPPVEEVEEVKDVKGSPGESGEVRCLRQRSPKHQPAEKIKNRMRLVDIDIQTDDLWNWAIENHSDEDCKAKKPRFRVFKEKKHGLAVAQSLSCRHCNFVTPLVKLFEEVKEPNKRGAKPAAVNVALVQALMHTSIGNQKARCLLSSLDIPVPCETSMDKLTARISAALAEEAERGMLEKLKFVTRENKSIHISVDTRYNTCRPGSCRRTGLPLTSQAITLAIENESGHNYVVSQFTQNKICPKGTALLMKGEEVQCPGHRGCTANISRFEPLSERAAGEAIGKKIGDLGITITHVTTDGDGKCHLGVQDVTPTPVKRQADTTHLAQTQKRKAKNTEWSGGLFPGVTTKVKKNLCTNALATDLKNRSIAVLKLLHEKHGGDLGAIKQEAREAIKGIIRCYRGDCQDCPNLTTACAGEEGNNNWLVQSSLLQEHKVHFLEMTAKDVDLMTNILNMIFSEESLEKTQFLTTTQQNEAINRSISVSLPKNLKFSKNYAGRLACQVETWNQGPGQAVARQRRALRLPTSPAQQNFFTRLQERSRWKKMYSRSTTTRRRMHRRDARLRLAKRMWQPQAEGDYEKHQLDDPQDHNYHQVCVFILSISFSYFTVI